MKSLSKILLLSLGITTMLISMDQPQSQSAASTTSEEIECRRLTENKAHELHILFAKEQRGKYCPDLYKAQQLLESGLETMPWLVTMNPDNADTNSFISRIINKKDGYNELISIFNYEGPHKFYKNPERFPMNGAKLLHRRCAKLIEENRYIVKSYGSCKPYQDRIITPLHYLLAKYAHQSLSPESPDQNIIIFCDAILSLGALPNARDDVGNTCLHHASTPEQVKLLCDYGAKLNKKGENGRTPLLNSIRLCNWPVAKCLLEYGANPHKKDVNNNSPFYKAVKKKADPTFIQLLLDKGAICIIHRKGKTIADLADAKTMEIIKKHVLSIISNPTNLDWITQEAYLQFYELELK